LEKYPSDKIIHAGVEFKYSEIKCDTRKIVGNGFSVQERYKQ
jgi:hypothetical protein